MKALRLELDTWGKYWARQEQGKGYATRSPCDKIGDVVVFGAQVVRELEVPRQVARYDVMIGRLSPNCKRAIRAHYVCKGQWGLLGFDSKKSYIYWLRRAEIQLAK